MQRIRQPPRVAEVLACGGEFSKHLLQLLRVCFPTMQNYAVPQRDRITLLECVLTLLGCVRLWKIFLAEGVCREQAVRAHVPTRHRSKTFRMTHDRDTNGFAVDRSCIIDP